MENWLAVSRTLLLIQSTPAPRLHWNFMAFITRVISIFELLFLFSFSLFYFLPSVITCPALEPSQNSVQLTNATNTDGSFDYLSNVMYSCNRGYETSHPTQLQCQSNGTWTNSVPVCKSKSVVMYCFQMTSTCLPDTPLCGYHSFVCHILEK